FMCPNIMFNTGAAATNQAFTSSGTMNITSCPITYYGRKYDKVYVAFSANRFAVCFNGLYKPGIKNDCILMSGGTADRGDLAVLSKEIPTGSGVHKLLPNLKNAGKCVNVIPLKDGQQSDVSVVYKTNTTVKDPNICSTVTCDVSGVATAVSDCGPMERCRGNGRCILNSVCTVTGSTIIDFIGRGQSVSDRCGYTLLKPSSIPGFRVLGIFQERRRRDVSFLDRVILQLDGEGIQVSLEQGGRVQLNNTVLTLNATAQVVHGVELSRDQTGVTAKISASNYTVSVLFDGDTTLIHMTGPRGAAVHGLCGNSSRTLNEDRVSEHSSTDCKTKYNDAADNTINCNGSMKWCKLLTQAPFAACNMYIDPEPFITACTQTLCKYPPADGLKCQFLEAYARACKHLSNVTAKDWRSKTSCCKPVLCQDKFCSEHEFCGEDGNSRETRCLCRATFASKYKPTSSFGEPIVCKNKSASVTLANCLLEDEGIDYSVLHLNDGDCKAEMDNLTHMVTFSFNSSNTCGTVIMANKSQVIYKNTIMSQNVSMIDPIIRHGPVHIDFSCYYSQPEMLLIFLLSSSVNQQMTSGEFNYNLTMRAYTSADRLKAIKSSTDIGLNARLWVELKTNGLDEKMVAVVTDSCWATNQPSPNGSLRHDLIINGCPNPTDPTVKMEENGLGTSNYFSFNTFQFSGKTGEVYLHCRVLLCVLQANTCTPSCSQSHRRRRSAMPKYVDENPGFITLAWTH
uniref:Alpha-tectorin-like n=1 Tax=Stegastes partitus TaxID=144197 RepID=A0A3B4ZZ41_9TELE